MKQKFVYLGFWEKNMLIISRWVLLAILILAPPALMAQSATNYVVPPGTPDVTPTPAYLSWATAATSIIDAVTAATNGNTVSVTNGTYLLTNRINLSKGITLRSVNGSSNTLVNGNNATQCFWVTYASAVIDGFTITNGFRGIYLNGGTISNSIITGNRSAGYGGGMQVDAGTVDSCSVIGNIANLHGGGIFIDGSNVTIKNNRISGNTCTNSSGNGGGVYCGKTGGLITNCIIEENYARYCGGGVGFEKVGQIWNSTISGNSNSGNGGGIYWKQEYGLIQNSTISNNISLGLGYGGGGIYFDSGPSNAVINCTIVGNTASGGGGGGGIFASSNCFVSGCTIANNNSSKSNGADRADGGGIYIQYSSGVIQDSQIFANTATNGYGGGVMTWGNLSGSSLTISNCNISNNCARYSVGVCAWGSVTILNSSISSNTGTASGGGGVYLPANSIMDNCIVRANKSQNTGAGIRTSGASVIQNCLIQGNWSSGGYNGAGIYNQYATVINCTIVSNTTAGNGGGIYNDNGTSINSIIYFNTGAGAYSNWYSSGTVAYTNNCTAPTNGLTGSGNISANPQFVNASNGNYRLLTDSPCINTGLNQDWMTNSYDLDGRTRIRYGTVDMGAYEKINEATIYNFH